MTVSGQDSARRCLVVAGLMAILALVPVTTRAGEGPDEYKIAEVDPETCRQLAAYVGDGSVEYRPGVTADGRPVVPADLGDPEEIKAKETLTFSVRVIPLRGRGTNYSDVSILEIGSAVYDTVKDKLTVNGTVVGGGQKALIEACGRRQSSSRQEKLAQ